MTAKVRIETTQAERALSNLQKKITNINKTLNKKVGKTGLDAQISKARIQEEKLKQSILKTKAAELKVTEQKHRTALAAQKVKQATDQARQSTNGLLSTVKKLAGTYLGMKTVGIAINASDTVTSTQNRLNALNGNDTEKTAESMDKIYAASQRARTGYDHMLKNVSKTMTLAPDAFQGNIDNAIRFQEIMAKSYTIGGAEPTEASTSMYQLVQALGSGVLQGDELRSVREGAPIAYKEIEKFAQGVYNTTDSLKDMASEGMITSNMVVAAIMGAGDQIEEKFNNTKITFEQAWTSIKNTAMKAFQPALESMNKMLNSDAGKAIVEGIGTAMIIVGNAISWVINLFSTLLDWIYSIATGSTVAGKIILNILLIIGIAIAVIMFPKFIAWIGYLLWVAAYYTYVGAMALAAGIKAAIAWMAANWVLLLIIVVIAAVVTAVIWLSDSFSDACGMIVGGIMAAIAFVWNLFLSLLDLVLGVVNAMWNHFAMFANFFANFLNDPVGSIIHLFGDMADYILGVCETIASALDKLFGTHMADSVANWRASLDAKITAAAEKHGNGKYDEKIGKANLTSESLGLKRWAYGDAYNTGYKWGESAGNWITDKVSNLGNMLKGGGLPDPNDPAYAVDGAYDPSGALKGIKGDTGDIKDSMQLENEDLEYMRKIAEMEWKNEFTTAEIKVDMTNHNTVNGERDLDGIVAYLSDILREEMTSVAYGVH